MTHLHSSIRIAVVLAILASFGVTIHARAQQKKDEKRGTVSGMVTAKAGNWIEIKSDGEEKARRYFTGSDQKAFKAVKATEVGSRVKLEWRHQEVFRVVKIEVLKGAKAASDQEKIQGTWTLVSAHRGGKAMPADAVKDFRIIFAGDKMKFQNAEVVREFEFKERATSGLRLDARQRSRLDAHQRSRLDARQRSRLDARQRSRLDARRAFASTLANDHPSTRANDHASTLAGLSRRRVPTITPAEFRTAATSQLHGFDATH